MTYDPVHTCEFHVRCFSILFRRILLYTFIFSRFYDHQILIALNRAFRLIIMSGNTSFSRFNKKPFMSNPNNKTTCDGLEISSDKVRVILNSTYFMSVEKTGDSAPKLFHLPYMKNRSICRRAASLVCEDELQYKELLEGDNIRFVPHKGRWTIRQKQRQRHT